VLDSAGFVEPDGHGSSVEFLFQVLEREEFLCLSGISKFEAHVTMHHRYYVR
jgi:hypothetical protein